MLLPSFVGVPLGPGQHQVRLEYRASPLRGGLLLAGLAGLVLIALAEWRRADLAQLISW